MTSVFCSSGYYLVHEPKNRIFITCLHEREHKGKHRGEHVSKVIYKNTYQGEVLVRQDIVEPSEPQQHDYEWNTPEAAH
jgi:hypothetical protein